MQREASTVDTHRPDPRDGQPTGAGTNQGTSKITQATKLDLALSLKA